MITELTKDQRLVYDLIVNSGGRITQLDIARKAPSLGSHERHEGYLSMESTLRKVRQIIRDLRIKNGLFILSDRKGYWIMRNDEEKREYLTRLEKQARASAKAYHVTYECMKRNCGMRSEYFEKQLNLFNQDN